MKKVLIFIALLLAGGCSSDKIVVNSTNEFCDAEGICYTIERIFFVNVHYYWEPGSTVEEVRRRAYRISDTSRKNIKNSIAYCADDDFCFENEVSLALCNENLTILNKIEMNHIYYRNCKVLQLD